LSSIRDAIAMATRESLSNYLAPDLVDQLTEEIISRAASEMEKALLEFAGFELGRPGTVRAKSPAQAANRKLNRVGRKRKDEDTPELQAFRPDSPEPTSEPMHLT
jgi:hypothetical protein